MSNPVRLAACALAVTAAVLVTARQSTATAPMLTTLITTDGAPAGAAAHLVVLYNAPKDTAAFEQYYSSKHLPLLASKAKEIGFTSGVLVKFLPSADGKAPQFYRKAELTFSSLAALQKGLATPGFKAVAADIPNFATGGFTPSVGVETK
jgi:uncharacterized protein (TIGR02118 family)